MEICSGPFLTAADIRAAHVDASGAIVSLVSLEELAQTESWHGLRPGPMGCAMPMLCASGLGLPLLESEHLCELLAE